MKVLVIYDSFFGNTEKIAKAIASATKAELLHIDNCAENSLEGIDYLIVGSPTRAAKPTEKIMTFLKSLSEDSLNGVNIIAFDTRIDVEKVNSKALKFFAKIFGYAASQIEKELVKKGGNKVVEGVGFFVEDKEGPLREGEEKRAAQWGKSNVK